jgi:hypothetical protein
VLNHRAALVEALYRGEADHALLLLPQTAP